MHPRSLLRTAAPLVLLLALAAAAWAQVPQPATITRLDASLTQATFLPPVPTNPGGAATDVGAGGTAGIYLYFTGTNFFGNVTAQWTTSGGTTVTLPAPFTSTGSILGVNVPRNLLPDVLAAPDPNVTLTLIVPARGSVSTPFKVNPALAPTTTFPPATVGVPYTLPLVTGGTPPYTLVNSVVPTWLTFNPATGTLSGTPPAVGSESFTTHVGDGWATVTTSPITFTIAQPVTISNNCLARATLGVTYSCTFSATGGNTDGSYAWTVLTGSTVPPGLVADTGFRAVMTLSGTPTTAAATPYTVVVQAQDPNGRTAQQTIQITVDLPLSVSPPAGALPRGTYNQFYSATFTATGGVGPYVYSFGVQGSQSTWPAGTSLNPNTGVFSGTPTAQGDFSVTLFVTDVFGRVVSQPYTLHIDPAIITTPSPPRGMWGSSYSYLFTVTGGLTSLVWTVASGTLPPGLTLGAGGLLSGTPTSAAGSPYTFSVQGVDTFNRAGPAQFSIVIDPQLTLGPAALPNVELATPYNQSLAAAGGLPPYTYSLDGALPPGLTLNPSTGAITGTPTAEGRYAFVAVVSDALLPQSRVATRDLSITVTVPQLRITTASPLPAGIAGVAYTQTFAATGAIGTPTWTVTAGALPQGLTLSAGGVLSGIPRQQGIYNFTVQASYGPTRIGTTQTASAPFVLNIGPTNLTLAPQSLPGAREGDLYRASFSATGATPPYTFAIQSGSLPPGLTLDSRSGVITGTLNGSGTFGFTGQVTDSSGQTATRAYLVQIERLIETLRISSGSLSDGTYQVAYSASFGAAGGIPPYSWTADGLPPGLTMYRSGNVAGKPTDIGRFSVTVTVSDDGGRTASQTYTITIKPEPLVITNVSPLGTVTLGSSVSETFTAQGGVPPYAWSIVDGSIPSGTTFSAGVLSGTTTAAGDFVFSVGVKDSKGATASKGFLLKVVVGPLRITTTELPAGMVGQGYSASVGASGGVQPYRFSIGGLPAGLRGNDGGSISGTPTEAGTASVTATVTDSKGTTASATFDLVIKPAALIITTSSALGNVTVGQRYSETFAATGGKLPYRWSMVAGFAGGGLSFSSDGVLSGIPADAGPQSFTLQVTDSLGAVAAKDFTLTGVVAPLTITTASLPNGMAGSAYSAGVAATGGTGTISFSATGLPDGVSMSASGSISGTPAAPGTFTVNVTATDGAGRTATRSLTLTIGLPAAPGVSFRGVPDVSEPAKQPPVGLGLDGTYPLTIAGQVTLTFTADSGGDDPTVQFSNGRRTVDFTVPAGANLATFTVPSLALQTGTVAGTITLTATLQSAGSDITPSPAPARTIRINRSVPVISRVTITRTATGFDVSVTGFSTTREVSQAIFRFTAAAGGTLQTTEVTVPVDALFTAWFGTADARALGSQFLFRQPFNVTGDTATISSVTVILVNAVGRSDPATANMP